jgi:hypothetical protein
MQQLMPRPTPEQRPEPFPESRVGDIWAKGISNLGKNVGTALQKRYGDDQTSEPTPSKDAAAGDYQGPKTAQASTDTVPIMATPGEHVMNVGAADMFRPILELMNKLGLQSMQGAQFGGEVEDKKKTRTAGITTNIPAMQGGGGVPGINIPRFPTGLPDRTIPTPAGFPTLAGGNKSSRLPQFSPRVGSPFMQLQRGGSVRTPFRRQGLTYHGLSPDIPPAHMGRDPGFGPSDISRPDWRNLDDLGQEYGPINYVPGLPYWRTGGNPWTNPSLSPGPFTFWSPGGQGTWLDPQGFPYAIPVNPTDPRQIGQGSGLLPEST